MQQLVEEDIDLHPVDLPNLRRLALSQSVDVSPFELSDGALPLSRTVDRATAQLERGTPAFWCVPFFIVSVPRRRIVGSCGFKTAPDQGSVEIHCGVAASERSRGVATAAIRKLIDLAFSTGIANEVFACVRPDNIASSKVVERLGFVAGPLITDSNGEEVVRWSWSQPGNSFEPKPLPGSQMAPQGPRPELSLRPALEADFGFCESLTRANMASYLAARGIPWDPQRHLASWAQFENLVISADGSPAGILRLLQVEGALEIRDLQVLAPLTGQGIGAWAIEQAKGLAMHRGLPELRLRVYVENPARRLYARLGFRCVANDNGVMHLSCSLPAGNTPGPQPFADSTGSGPDNATQP
ncbi:hypothetical protein GCM10027431_32190 [Lysobacter rhizosphaerae]